MKYGDTLSDLNSCSISDISELNIHSLLIKSRAKFLEKDFHQDPVSDQLKLLSELLEDNAADNMELTAVSMRVKASNELPFTS